MTPARGPRPGLHPAQCPPCHVELRCPHMGRRGRRLPLVTSECRVAFRSGHRLCFVLFSDLQPCLMELWRLRSFIIFVIYLVYNTFLPITARDTLLLLPWACHSTRLVSTHSGPPCRGASDRCASHTPSLCPVPPGLCGPQCCVPRAFAFSLRAEICSLLDILPNT